MVVSAEHASLASSQKPAQAHPPRKRGSVAAAATAAAPAPHRSPNKSPEKRARIDEEKKQSIPTTVTAGLRSPPRPQRNAAAAAKAGRKLLPLPIDAAPPTAGTSADSGHSIMQLAALAEQHDVS